jgi:hypothetical protein
MQLKNPHLLGENESDVFPSLSLSTNCCRPWHLLLTYSRRLTCSLGVEAQITSRIMLCFPVEKGLGIYQRWIMLNVGTRPLFVIPLKLDTPLFLVQ